MGKDEEKDKKRCFKTDKIKSKIEGSEEARSIQSIYYLWLYTIIHSERWVMRLRYT